MCVSPIECSVVSTTGVPGQPGRRAGVDLGPVQVRVHHVVAALGDDRTQPQQRAQLGVAPHARGRARSCRWPGSCSATGPGLYSVTTSRVMPGVLQDHGQLELGAADVQTGDHVQDLHRRLPLAAM